MRKLNIAIVGATGLVGSKFLEILNERQIPINNLYLYASERSSNKTIIFQNKEYKVITLASENIINQKIDYALFSAGEKISRSFAQDFINIGAVVIDNSSAFRMDSETPLIVPEVNSYAFSTKDKLISNPNCSTIQCMSPLKALHKLFELKRVDYTTFQAVSGSGMKGIKDLEETQKGNPPAFYPHSIFNNCLPHIGDFIDNNYTKEEIKMVKESQKILNLPNLEVSATCVRVPINNSHSIEIDAEFKKTVDINLVKETLSNYPGITLLDSPSENVYPLATIASGTDSVYVGRIRVDLFDTKKLHFFSVADNIRKGAATNAVQILEVYETKLNLSK